MDKEPEVVLSAEGQKVIKRHLEGCQAVLNGDADIYFIDLPDNRYIIVNRANAQEIMETLHERTAVDYPELTPP